MKTLSYWAKANRKKTWILIAIAKVLFAFLAFLFSSLLFVCDHSFPASTVLIAISIVIFVFAFYPIKGVKKGWYKYSYTKQKRFDGLLLTAEFLLLLCFFQQQFVPHPTGSIEGAASFIVLQEVDKKINEKPKKSWKEQYKTRKKELRKELKKFKQTLKKNNTVAVGFAKFLLGLLLILAVLGVGYLVAIFSCQLSCNGHEEIALAVLIVGWGGLITGLIFGIRHIARMKFDKVPDKLKVTKEKTEGKTEQEQ